MDNWVENYRLPESEEWPELFKQGSLAELLDLTQYLSSDQQSTIWPLAVNSLLNSEDAAALAKLYRHHPPTQKVLKPQLRKLKSSILYACSREIDTTDDPDHLQAILSDLYRIDDALDLNIRPSVEEIYLNVFEVGWEEHEDFEERAVSYCYQPEAPGDQAVLAGELRLVRSEVDGMFLGWKNHGRS